MTVAERLGLREQRPPHNDYVLLAKDWLVAALGVRADFDLLDVGEQHELLELIDAAKLRDGVGVGVHMGQLDDRQRRQFERLVEKTAALPPGTFDRRREADAARAKTDALARRAKRPPQPRAGQEIALLTEMHEHVRDGFLSLPQLGVFAHVLGMILAANPIAPGSRVEGGGDALVLVLDGTLGLGADFDPDGEIGRWPKHLQHLNRNQWLKVERSGRDLRVRMGARTLRALREPK